MIKKSILNFIRRIVGTEKILMQTQSVLSEIYRAQMFHDATIDSEWYTHKDLSLGPAAIDYGTAYVIYRVLDMIHPTNLLEFGLGQSSKIIHQYANYYAKPALTIEHSAEWIKFFSNDVKGKYPVHTKLVELEESLYRNYKTQTYRALHEVLGSGKYDFIFIDGPFGFGEDGNFMYSRVQIVDMIKHNLADSFCIIMHDYERIGEQNTIKEVLQTMRNNKIEFHTKEYSAAKKCLLICSKDMYFLTTL